MVHNPTGAYSFREQSQLTGGRFGGQFMVDHNMVDLYRLAWGGGACTVRFLPPKQSGATPENPLFEPYRLSAEPNAFGDWIRAYPAVTNFGRDASGGGASFLIRDVMDTHSPPVEESPPHILYNAVSNAVKNAQDQQGWAALLQGGTGRSAALPKPSMAFFAQVLVFQHKNVINHPPKGWVDKPQLLSMTQSAAGQLQALMNAMLPGADPRTQDYQNSFVNGDMVSLEPGCGRFVTFWKGDEPDPRVARASAGQLNGPAAWAAQAAQQGSGRAQGGSNTSYACYAEDNFNGLDADFSSFKSQLVGQSIQWDTSLVFHDYEQQAQWIADKFPPSVILYAFHDHPEWIPDRVRQLAVAAMSVAGGGYGMPGVMHGMMPQGYGVQGMPGVQSMPGMYGAPSVQGMPGVYGAPGLTGSQVMPQPQGEMPNMPSTLNPVPQAVLVDPAQQPAMYADAATANAAVATPFVGNPAAVFPAVGGLPQAHMPQVNSGFPAHQLTQQAGMPQQMPMQQMPMQQMPMQQIPMQQMPMQQMPMQQMPMQQMPMQQMPMQQMPQQMQQPAQVGAAMAGLVAGMPPVAVVQPTVMPLPVSNVATQPAAGFAMPVAYPTNPAPQQQVGEVAQQMPAQVAQPAAAGGGRAQLALAAAQAAAGVTAQ